MADLEQLKAQLSQSVERLEAAAASPQPPADFDRIVEHRDVLIAEVAKLKAGEAHLKAELGNLKKRYAMLQKVTNRVSGGLDNAIAEIENVLDS